jgi:hypothetical protein
MEIWKDVIGYEGKYQVSNLGNVKSLARIVYISNIPRNRKLMYLKPKISGVGYHQVCLQKESIRFYRLVHRLVAESFLGLNESKKYVNHINGIKTDNRVENLEWLTQSENQLHAYKIGLQNKQYGEQRYCSKLNNEKVILIKKRLQSGESYISIAPDFDVSPATVFDIYKNKTWVRVII